MRTLVQALKEHTGCTHKLSGDYKKLRHGNDYCWPSALIYDWPKETPMGSRVFHEAAEWLMDLPGHSDHPLHITDEEFANYVSEDA